MTKMFSLGWGEGGEVWLWRRKLLACEAELVRECRTLLYDVSLQVTITNEWQWCLNVGNGYTVCGMNQMLTRQEMHSYNSVSASTWHKSVLLKVYICVWRLLRNRWLTKDNFVRRDIISNDSQLCVFGCGYNESADHLLLHCPVFSTLWQFVKERLRVYLVDPHHILDHFHMFDYSSGGFKPKDLFCS